MTNITIHSDETRNRMEFLSEFNKVSKKLGLKYRCSFNWGRSFLHIYGGINPFWFNILASQVCIFSSNRVYINLSDRQLKNLTPIFKKLKQYEFIIN